MLTKKLGFILVIPMLLLAMASSSYAEISNAAVLFLRIAPGARAAGMGEAFVAIADDATASHWNPAGLGAYPLADGWSVTDVPEHMRPLRSMALVHQGDGQSFSDYEIWALSDKVGLVRYEDGSWYSSEEFSTKTDQTVKRIVGSYFKVEDEERLNQMVARVARANAPVDRDQIVEMRDTVLEQLPEDYRDREFLTKQFDSLLLAYDEVRLRSERVSEAVNHFREGMKDSILNEGEIGRIQVNVERGYDRFINEDLDIPYSIIFDGNPNDIASRAKNLVVAANNGLFTYNGRSWQTLTEADGLPSNEVLSLYSSGSLFYVGTANGLVMFGGRDITSVDGAEQLPEGPVTAIASDGVTRLWIVLNGQLYRYNGRGWSTAREYKIAVDDTFEKIAERFAVYGTEEEKAAFIAAIKELNPAGPMTESQAAEVTAEETMPLVEGDITDMIKAQSVDTTEMAETEAGAEDTTMAAEETADTTKVATEPYEWGELPPGDFIWIPYAVDVKGDINSMLIRRDDVFIGTDYGLIFFDGEEWHLPGYEEYPVETATPVEEILALRKASKDESGLYAEAFTAVNGIEGDTVAAGDTVLVYRNAVGARINLVSEQGATVYIASTEGLRALRDGKLLRISEKGMDNANAIYVEQIGGDLWLASDERMAVGTDGRTEFSLMHVNWLPELADDMYYEFLSGVFQLGDVGTLGLNLTYLTYGSISRTGQTGPDVISTFESYDVAFTGAFGFSVTQKLKMGFGAKIIYSNLSDQGAGAEKGKGTSTGFAGDFGLLYQASPRLNIGMAFTNLGPDMAYIDAAQSDPLPRNFSLGFAYKILNSKYNRLLFTAEANKILVDVDDSFSQELKETIFNTGAEFIYADLIAVRAGYIHDEEGKVKTITLGAGLKPLDWMRADFSYIPNNDDVALANTLRMSFSIMP